MPSSFLNTAVVIACLFVGSQANAAEPNSAQPLYEQLLALLRSTDSVLPRLPNPAHPTETAYNPEAIVPPQCYTRTESKHNPCYVCHQASIPGRENTMRDDDIQSAYSFSEVGMTNHWRNLFENRSEKVAKISDDEIIQWTSQDNYSELAGRLKAAGFKGWIPDLADLNEGGAAFDEIGFAKDGSHWVAFNYKPLPSTFWPTNGSTDDVMIRLPAPFRNDKSGQYSADIYKANLAILEAKIKGKDSIASLPIEETKVGKDLDGDGELGIAKRIAKVDAYVGAAEKEFIDTFLYPENTEFLHTVRYLSLADDGGIVPSTRMKEVRYMRKWKAYRKLVYHHQYVLENNEKNAGNLPSYHDLGDNGLDNGSGWSIQGFIEGKDGRLRASTYEENLFCMGCHNSIGSTIDKTFSFARKVDGESGWRYINLKGMPDAPSQGETKGEILTYLERVGGGDEFRNNAEMLARWFNPDGKVNVEKVQRAKDVAELITPSKERALLLNKAYRTIVADQDYIFGRDATVTPPKNVYQKIDNDNSPTLPESLTYRWNLVLDWPSVK